jgi:hypothetical protein
MCEQTPSRIARFDPAYNRKEQNKNIFLARAAPVWQESMQEARMVHRKRTFTEIDGQKLLEAMETFGRSVVEAQQNAPFGSEIFAALEALSGAVRHVQVTFDRRSRIWKRRTPQHVVYDAPAKDPETPNVEDGPAVAKNRSRRDS